MNYGRSIKPSHAGLSIAAATLALVVAGCGLTPTGSAGGAFFSRQAGETVDSPFGKYLAGRFAGSERDTAAAADYYEAVLEVDPDNERLLQRTFYLNVAEGRMERAVDLAEHRVTDDSDASLPQLVLCVHDIKRGDYAAARERIEETDRTGFAALLQPLVLAWIEAGSGNAEAAMAALDELAERSAFDTFRLFHTALINDYLGRAAAAEEAYRKTRESPAGSVTSVVLAYGSFLYRQGRLEEARRLLAEHVEQFPENPVVTAALQDLDAGRPLRPPVAEVADGIAEAFHGAAGALAHDRANDPAKIYVRLALYMRPGYDSAQMLLGEILEGNGRPEEAIAAYEEVEESSPYHWDARVRIASALNRQERVDEAIAVLRSMADERKQDVTALVTLADLFRSHERFEEAAKAYDEAVGRVGKLEPRHWALLYARGIAFERSGNWTRAEQDFVKALELMPDQPLVLNYLGYSWVERGQNLDRARRMIEMAVEQRPNDGYIVDSLGWVLYRLGDYEGAVKHLERAVELLPEDPIINDHLGDAFWRVGRRLEARFQWRHALALGAEQKDVPILEAKLESGLPQGKNGRDG